jgi:hypothetical protein
MNGYPVYSISEDCGRTWTRPRPFRCQPGGDLLKNACGPCQISSTADGRIYFLFSNRNDYYGAPGHWAKRWGNRDPVHVVVGREMPLLAKDVPVEEDNAGIYFDMPRVLLRGVSDSSSTESGPFCASAAPHRSVSATGPPGRKTSGLLLESENGYPREGGSQRAAGRHRDSRLLGEDARLKRARSSASLLQRKITGRFLAERPSAN